MTLLRLLYKPVGLLSGVVGGIAGGVAVKRVWRLVAHEDHPPEATAADYSWRQVLVAALVQGAVFGVVKAAVDRAGAVAYQKATGVWPGEE